MLHMTCLINLALFALTVYAAYSYNWQTNDLCWQLWLTSLLSGWLIIVVAVVRTILHDTGLISLPESDMINGSPLGGIRKTPVPPEADLARNLPAPWGMLLSCFFTLVFGAFVLFHFTAFHAIHALFMTIFVRIEPYSLFNPDTKASYSDILSHLLAIYWPVVVCTVTSRWRSILTGNPGRNMKAIYGRVVRMHIFILLSAFLGGVILFYGKKQYDQLILGVLLLLFYFPWSILKPQPVFNKSNTPQ
jgi:hypothetical protein